MTGLGYIQGSGKVLKEEGLGINLAIVVPPEVCPNVQVAAPHVSKNIAGDGVTSNHSEFLNASCSALSGTFP